MTSIHATTKWMQPSGISGQFDTPGTPEAVQANLRAFHDPTQASTHTHPRSAAREPPNGLPGVRAAGPPPPAAALSTLGEC